MPKTYKKFIINLKNYLNLILNLKTKTQWEYELFAHSKKFPPLIIITALIVIEDNELCEKLKIYLKKFLDFNINITGEDIIKIGFERGPIIEKVKRRVLIEKFKGNLITKEDELNFVKRLMTNYKNELEN